MFLVYITACRHHLNVSSRLIYKLLKGICIVTCHVSLVTQVASVTRHVSDKEFDRKYHSTTSVNWNIPIHFFPCVRSIIVNPVMVSPYSKISLKSHWFKSGCWTQNKVFKRIRNAALLLNQNKNQINSNDWLEKVKLHLDPAKNQNKNTFSGRSWTQENGRVSNTRNHQSRGVSPIQNYFQRTTITPCSCNGNEFAFSNLSSLMPSVFVTTFIVITDKKTKLV